MLRRSAQVAATPGQVREPFSVLSAAEAGMRELEWEITTNCLRPISVLLQQVVERVCSLMAADGVAVAVGDRHGAVCRASTGRAPDVDSPLRPDSALTRECLETGRVVVCLDTKTDSRVCGSTTTTLWLRSAVVVPLQAKGSVLGVIEVLSSRPFAFDGTHVARLGHIAEILASALIPAAPESVGGERGARVLVPPEEARPRIQELPTQPAREGSTSLRAISGLRPKLFYERYGILENPFGATPNPRYLYQSRTHAEARSSLIVGIECGVGFQALIAPPGMGKTTILFDVIERFSKVARTAFLFQIHGDSRDFLRYLISELGGEADDSDLVRMQDTINQLLIRERRTGRQTIIIIDEAQSLDTSVLETVRRLSNFETPTEKLLQIILAGQPQLAQRLANPEMAQLQQRISILTTLIPFDQEDTSKYIEHRLKIAGYQGPPLFTSAVLRLIWERSGGVPRKINTLCFNALLLARAVEQKQVDADILHEVMADLDLDRIGYDTSADGIPEVRSANQPQLGNSVADAPAPSIDRICKDTVSGAEAEAGDDCTKPTAFDVVDLAQLGTIAAKIVSTNRGEKTEQAAVSDAKMEVEDASARPTAFDGVDLVQLGATAAVSTSDGEKAELAAVSGAKAEDYDASTRPTTSDEVDLVLSGTTAPRTVSTNSGRSAELAAVPGAGKESDDMVGHAFLPDKPALAGDRTTDVVTLAGTGVADASSCETEAAVSSADALQVTPKARAVEAEWMPEAKQALSSEVESNLNPKARFDFFTGIKPDLKPKIEPESGSDVESTLVEVEPTVTVTAPLRIILGEADSKCGRVQISPGKRSAQEAYKWLKQKWQAHRVTIYLATSMLVFVLVLADWTRSRQSSPEPKLTIFEELLSSLGFAAPPPMPVHQDKGNIQVWVDLHTGLYYCRGAQLYGKTEEGKFTTERHARLEHFTAANRNLCQ